MERNNETKRTLVCNALTETKQGKHRAMNTSHTPFDMNERRELEERKPNINKHVQTEGEFITSYTLVCVQGVFCIKLLTFAP